MYKLKQKNIQEKYGGKERARGKMRLERKAVEAEERNLKGEAKTSRGV